MFGDGCKSDVSDISEVKQIEDPQFWAPADELQSKSKRKKGKVPRKGYSQGWGGKGKSESCIRMRDK